MNAKNLYERLEVDPALLCSGLPFARFGGTSGFSLETAREPDGLHWMLYSAVERAPFAWIVVTENGHCALRDFEGANASTNAEELNAQWNEVVAIARNCVLTGIEA